MDNTVDMDEDSDLGPTQTNRFGDRYFYKINPGTFYQTSAETLYDTTFGEGLFQNSRLYIVIGTDSGLLPKYVQTKGLPEGSRYIFIEPRAIFQELRDAGVLPELNERIVCTDESHWLDVLERFKIEDYLFINSVFSYESLAAQSNGLEVYVQLKEYVLEYLKQLYYKNNANIATEPYIIQQLINFADNNYPAIMLKNAFKDKTAFVLGGGPSLDEALPWLIQHRDYVVIFAASRVIRRLTQVGLKPDFVISGDPYHSNFEVSKEMLLLDSKVVLIGAYHLYYQLRSQWLGPALYLGERVPWHSPLNVDNLDAAPPTVTNVAIGVAYEYGFKRIYLAGVDFCFTASGHTHAQGSVESDIGLGFNQSTLQVETYAGAIAPTASDYDFAREMLEEQITTLYNERDCEFFNISLNAARVEGINYCSLDSIILDKKTTNVIDVLDAHAIFNPPLFSFKQLQAELNRALHQLRAIKKLAHEALLCNEGLYNAQGYIENIKDKKRLDKIERTLNHTYRHFGRTVKALGLREFLQIITFKDDDNWTAEELKTSLRTYYQSYINGASRLIEFITNTMQILLVREEEHKTHPNWDFIMKQAEQNYCYGRVRLWNKLDSAKDFTPEQSLKAQQLENAFTWCQNNKNDGGHVDSIIKKTDLSLLKTRIASLFKYHNIQALKNMLLALDDHHDKEGIIPYRFLLQGYISELEQNTEAALDAYQLVIEQGQGPLEEALLRIVSLALKSNQNEMAHQALGCLSQLNVQYLWQYGDSHRIQGDVAGAIDAYMAYLEQFPEDLLAQIKLAQFYMDQKIYEGAKIMVQYILEKHPDHKAALALKKQLEGFLGQ